MNLISLLGIGLAIIGLILLITNNTNYTHIGNIWVILCLIVGLVIAFFGGNLG